jgi:hypothetical protein
MKRFPLAAGILIAASFALSVPGLQAQMGPPATGVNATFAKLFGDHKTFSATADTLIEGGGDTITMPMELSMLDNNMRVDVDVTKMKSKQMPEGGGEMMKSMGMDRIITISQIGKKSTLLIIPGLKSLVDSPMTEDETASLDGETKAATTELGKETINGHPCTKYKVIITDSKGQKRDATVWKATDLKDFPMKMQMPEKDKLVTLTFTDVKLQKPDAKLFDAPEGYTKYGSMPELMGALMKRMISGGGN